MSTFFNGRSYASPVTASMVIDSPIANNNPAAANTPVPSVTTTNAPIGITLLQAWKAQTEASSHLMVNANALVSVPTAGNLLVAFFAVENTAIPPSIADDIGDGVGWNIAVNALSYTGGSAKMYCAWKQVGTPVGGGKTVTISGAAFGVTEMSVAEFSPSVPGVFSVDGATLAIANTTSANPNLGSITTSNAGLVLGFIYNRTVNETAGAGYTSGGIVGYWIGHSLVEYQYTSAAGIYPVPFTNASSVLWSAIGIAFKVT